MATTVKICFLVFVNSNYNKVDIYRKRQDQLTDVERTLIEDLDNSGRLLLALIEFPKVDDAFRDKMLSVYYVKYKKMPCPENFTDIKPLDVDALDELTKWKQGVVGWETCFAVPRIPDAKVEYDTKVHYYKMIRD